jgi:HK97 family phage major capsid protein
VTTPSAELGRDLLRHLYETSDRFGGQRGHWVMDAEWLREVLQLTGSDGGSLWQPTSSLAFPQSLLGRPVEIRKGSGPPHLEPDSP